MATRKEKIVWLDARGKEHDSEESADYDDAMHRLHKTFEFGAFCGKVEGGAGLCDVLLNYKHEVRDYLDAGEKLMARAMTP